ncbi:MAG: hypothetical protein NW203_14315 [Hyphomonadaceae bacterium]|nr:hypothetical protein [Hyphomonadaceae bacterium]
MATRRSLLAATLAGALATAGAAAAQPPPSNAARDQQRLTSAESYLPLPAINAGVIGRYGAVGVLTVEGGLDIPDAALRARATASRPRLSDALRQAVATYASTYYRADTAPDPDLMARQMQAAVDRALGAPGARFLMSGVIYQRSRR